MELHNETLFLIESLLDGQISESYFDFLVENEMVDYDTLEYVYAALEEGVTFKDIGLKSYNKSSGSVQDERILPGTEYAKEIAIEALNDYIDKAVPAVTQEKSTEPKPDKLSKILADKMSKIKA